AVIFQEFRKVHGTARREFGGTGLGLALVKRFIELQGGSVSIDSALEQGSTFSFTLPVRSRAAVITRPHESALVPAGGSDRVLVVEDDANAYDLIAAALGSAGYLSVRARHGEEALRVARDSTPDGIILGLMMPGLSGFDVAEALKDDPRTADIPILVLTSKEISSEDRALLHAKVSSFVHKGSAREHLLREIKRV